mmetsp:Transcript_24744/g.79670  ORF Transcript_24744/g.79670 Transcript_24744/m.79670 type:complete len:330 (+) Transcript_24744:3660-4649(+)
MRDKVLLHNQWTSLQPPSATCDTRRRWLGLGLLHLDQGRAGHHREGGRAGRARGWLIGVTHLGAGCARCLLDPTSRERYCTIRHALVLLTGFCFIVPFPTPRLRPLSHKPVLMELQVVGRLFELRNQFSFIMSAAREGGGRCRDARVRARARARARTRARAANAGRMSTFVLLHPPTSHCALCFIFATCCSSWRRRRACVRFGQASSMVRASCHDLLWGRALLCAVAVRLSVVVEGTPVRWSMQSATHVLARTFLLFRAPCIVDVLVVDTPILLLAFFSFRQSTPIESLPISTPLSELRIHLMQQRSRRRSALSHDALCQRATARREPT